MSRAYRRRWTRNPETDICRNCRFFDAILKPEPMIGTCRINPPNPQYSLRSLRWPIVKTTDWCGQFSPVPSTDPEPEPTALAESSTKPETGSQPQNEPLRNAIRTQLVEEE